MTDALEDLPAFLSRKLTPSERDAAWSSYPDKPTRASATPHELSEEERLIADGRERDRLAAEEIATGRDAIRAAKTSARIGKLLASKAPKPDRTGQRWCARRARWITD